MKKTLVNRAAGRSRGGKAKCPAVPSGSTPPPATTNNDYSKGSEVAFLEAAEKMREEASLAFLGLHDEVAFKLRDMVRYFLEQAQLCGVNDED